MGEDTKTYRFADWLIRPHLNEIRRGGEVKQLEPLAMDVLSHLLESAGEVVTADELLDLHWAGRSAEPSMVSRCITQIRAALGDNARHPEYIETIRKRGYRTIGSVACVFDAGGTSEGANLDTASAAFRKPKSAFWIGAGAALVAVALGISLLVTGVFQRGAPDAQPLTRSLSVLPFEIVGDDHRLGVYGSGLNAELRRILASFPEIQTIRATNGDSQLATSSTTYLVTGSLESFDERFRLHLQILEPVGRSVWSASYDADLDTGPDGRESLATTIGRNIRFQVMRGHECAAVRHKTQSAQAAEYACLGLAEVYGHFQGGVSDPEIWLAYAEKALALDPDIVEAHWQRAVYYLGRNAPLANNAIDTAYSIEPTNPKVLWLRGIQLMMKFDYRASEASLVEAVQRDPLSPWASSYQESLAILRLRQGDLEAAREHYRRALRIHDGNTDLYRGYARLLYISGEFRDALTTVEAGLSLVSRGVQRYALMEQKAAVLIALGDTQAALAVVHEMRNSEDPAWREPSPVLLARLGHLTEARRRLTDLEAAQDPPTTYYVKTRLYAYILLGERDQAFRWLARAIEDPRAATVRYLRIDPVFDELRDDPRWSQLMGVLEEKEAVARVQ